MVINVELIANLKNKFETFESLWKRFAKKCKKEGINRDFFDHMFFKTPAQKRRDKQRRAAFLKRKRREQSKKFFDSRRKANRF